MKFLNYIILTSLIVMGASLYSEAQNTSLRKITNSNPDAVVIHALETDSNLFVMSPSSIKSRVQSGFKIYKVNVNFTIIDSITSYFNQSQTFATNLTKGKGNKMNFAVSIGENPSAIKVYTITSQLKIIDSLFIQDNNFLANKFVFGNLIEGPNGDFVLNTVFYKDTMPYNVYYLLDQDLNIKNKFTDSSFWSEKIYNTIVTGNMLFINNQYVILQSTPPEIVNAFNAVKRFTPELNLIQSEKINDILYAQKVFHCPLNINNKWIIANMFTLWEGGSKSSFSANLIEIDSENKINQKTKIHAPYGSQGGNNISNYGAIYNKEKGYIELIYTQGGGFLGDYAERLTFDTSFKLINYSRYEYPVNKIDTIYHYIQINGCVLFNKKLLIYGYLYKSEKGKRDAIEIPFPFIESIEDLDLLSGLEKTNLHHNNIAVYPNPFINEVTINFSENNLMLTLTDNTGRLLVSQNIETNAILNLENLKAGIYYLSALGQDGQKYSQKLIKLD
jgi:hypothetical protein